MVEEGAKIVERKVDQGVRTQDTVVRRKGEWNGERKDERSWAEKRKSRTIEAGTKQHEQKQTPQMSILDLSAKPQITFNHFYMKYQGFYIYLTFMVELRLEEVCVLS